MTEATRVFTDIYDRKVWGAGSGGGSTPQHIRPYLGLVERIVEKEDPSVVLDIGCGNGLVASCINWGYALYIGVDPVQSVILEARARISRLNFIVADALSDSLLPAGLVLIKEVTQHLDTRSIVTLLQKLASYPAVLHTSMIDAQPNRDIAMGDTRSVDLSLPPFNLPCETLLEYSVGETRYRSQMWRP